MKRVIVERKVSSKPIFAPVARVLKDASIRFTHDVTFTDGICFNIDDSYFPHAREIFEKLREDGIIDNFKIEAKRP